MRIAIVQSDPAFGRVDANLEDLVRLVRGTPADFHVLPELCLSGYDFEDRAEALAHAEEAGSPRLEALAAAATGRGAGIVFGFCERVPGAAGEAPRCYNSALLALPDGRRRVYRKTHLFARERLLFDPGDTGFFVEDFLGARIGVAICFDWLFPESFRTLALKGADLVAHCANLVLPFCQRADFTRAVENRVFVATANRVGSEARGGRSLAFTGSSVLVSPRGDYLLELPAAGEAAAACDIEPLSARDKSLPGGNDVLADRRPEYYEL